MGRKIMEGTVLDAMKISRPAKITNYISYLESISNDLIFCSPYLNAAAKTSDPVERLKYVVSFVIGSLHKTIIHCMAKAPANPILGETFQAHKADGTSLYMEQISHHPPVSIYSIYGPDGLYVAHGCGEPSMGVGLNTVNGYRQGLTRIRFKDGGEVSFTNAYMFVNGLMMGKRTLHYIKTITCTDHTNGLTALVTFSDDGSGRISKLASAVKNWWNGTKNSTPSDHFTVNIFREQKIEGQNQTQTEILSEGSGSWLEYVQFDGVVYWRISDKIEPWNSDEEILLPSHSQSRLDSILIKAKEYDKAQIEKERLEELQRHDAKIRRKPHHN
eukprot:TRINITY_DN1353_c0_g2_i6.p1 TRINITY_DN1353_c0_g2~~TRINITY_DN1353_c0_g2_i6.p1  ORF type:complete len:330 (-),score=24.72 TRINITY_DN1353_c0_g2_i6:99-1088(-)